MVYSKASYELPLVFPIGLLFVLGQYGACVYAAGESAVAEL
jgi:hypothetical protein